MCEQNEEDKKDIILINVEEMTYKVKRSLLMQRSRYFSELLSGYEDMCLITLERTTSDIFNIVLCWLHTNDFNPPEYSLSTFVKVFNSAVQFSMGELEFLCEEFARDYFINKNGPVLYDVIQREGNKSVCRRVRALLMRCFQAIVEGPYYVEFGVHHVCLLLADTAVCVESEIKVLQAALRWLNHDWPLRQRHAPQVLGCVRFGLMSKEDLLSSTLSWDTQRCLELSAVKKMVIEAFLYHSAVKTGRIASLPFLVPTIRARLPASPIKRSLQKYNVKGSEATWDTNYITREAIPTPPSSPESTGREKGAAHDSKKFVRFEANSFPRRDERGSIVQPLPQTYEQAIQSAQHHLKHHSWKPVPRTHTKLPYYDVPVMESTSFATQTYLPAYPKKPKQPPRYTSPPPSMPHVTNFDGQENMSVRVFRNPNPADKDSGKLTSKAAETYFEPSSQERKQYVARQAGYDPADTARNSIRQRATGWAGEFIPQYKTDRKRITILPRPTHAKTIGRRKCTVNKAEEFDAIPSTKYVAPIGGAAVEIVIPRTIKPAEYMSSTVPVPEHETNDLKGTSSLQSSQGFALSRPPATCEDRMYTVPYEQFLADEYSYYIAQNFPAAHAEHVCSTSDKFGINGRSEIQSSPSKFVPSRLVNMAPEQNINEENIETENPFYFAPDSQCSDAWRSVPMNEQLQTRNVPERLTRTVCRGTNPPLSVARTVQPEYKLSDRQVCPLCATPLPFGLSKTPSTAGGDNYKKTARLKIPMRDGSTSLNTRSHKGRCSKNRAKQHKSLPEDNSSSSEDYPVVRIRGGSKSTDEISKAVPKTKQQSYDTNPRRQLHKLQGCERGGETLEDSCCRIVRRERLTPGVPTRNINPANDSCTPHDWKYVQNRSVEQPGRVVPRSVPWETGCCVGPRTICRDSLTAPCRCAEACRVPPCVDQLCCQQCQQVVSCVPESSCCCHPKQAYCKPLSPRSLGSDYSDICQTPCAATEKCGLCPMGCVCKPRRKTKRKRGGGVSESTQSESPWENERDLVTVDNVLPQKLRAGARNCSVIPECAQAANRVKECENFEGYDNSQQNVTLTGSAFENACASRPAGKFIQMDVTRCHQDETMSSSSSSKSISCSETVKSAVFKARKWLRCNARPAEQEALQSCNKECRIVPQPNSCHQERKSTAAAAVRAAYRKYMSDREICEETGSKCSAVLEPGLQMAKPCKEPKDQIINSPTTATTACLDGSPSIIVFGGLSPHQTDLQTASRMLLFRPLQNDWQVVGQTPKPFIHSACAMISCCIYLSGGVTVNVEECSEVPQNWAWCLDCQTGSWLQCPQMLHPRSHHASVEIGGKVYVIGGSGECESYLSSVECFEPGLNRWIEMAPLGCPRTALAATVFRDKIWVCGGAALDAATGNTAITGCVESYTPQTNRWRSRVPLCQPRMSAALVVTACTMYLVGGATLKCTIPEVEMYDVSREGWVLRSQPEISREAAACVVMRDLVFFIGGFSLLDQCALDSVVCLLPGLSGCVDGIPNLPYPLTGMCAAPLDPTPAFLA